MTITYQKLFEPLALTGAPVTIFTVIGPSTTLLRGGRVRVVNTTGTPATVTIYAVPLAGSGGTTNVAASAKVVGANDFMDIDLPIMKLGDFLQAFSGTASALTLQPMAGAFFA